MKKITLLLLFLIFISVLHAQITPDGTTNTTTDDTGGGGVIRIDIAAPVNGLSNNTYSDFNIPSSGIILNNSGSTSTSQLTNGNITGNSNITTGNEASIILNQVTSNNTSSLEGKTEVVGTNAGVIIANPNGISCDGCGFINASKVDLVIGTSNFSGSDLTGFNINNAAILTVSGDGFLSDAVADELNLVSQFQRIKAQTKANNTLRVLAGNFTYDHTTNIITSDAIDAAGTQRINISASVSLEANYIELISTEISSGGIRGIQNTGGNISANSLKIDSNGLFRNQSGGNINISGLLEVTNAERFINNDNITADTLTITTEELTNTDNGSDKFGKIFVTDTFSLSTPNASYLNTGTVTSDSLNLTIGGDFVHESDTLENFIFNNLAITTGNFTNNATIDLAGNLGITANSFVNTGEVVNADNFALSVAGDFDYSTNFLNNGTITANALNLNVGGDFSNTDSASDFTWRANDILTVAGTASVVTASFNNSGNINVTNNSFDITAASLNNSGTISANTTLNTTLTSTLSGSFDNTGGVLNAHTVSLSVAGDFDGTKEGIINATIFNLTAGGSFINDDTNNDFVLGENDSLSISGDFTIATNNYIQSGMLDVAGALDISAMGDFTNNTGGSISADTLDISAMGDFTNNTGGSISADTLDISAMGDFTNNTGGSISADTLDISAMGDFTNNTGGSISADTLNITATGLIRNQGTIETANSLTINTDTIHNSGDITANSFLNINAMNNVFSGGSITTNALDIEAGRNFANGGTISTDSFEITAGYTVINQGSIASDSLDVTTDDFFRNLTGGEINVATLNITAGGKVTNTATIDVSGILSITANNDSARTDDPAGAFFYVSNRGNITAGSFTIEAVDNFYNRGNITTTSNFTTSAKSVFLLNEEIDSFYAAGNTYDGGTITLGGTSGLITDGGIVENYGNIDLGGFDLTIVADSFINQASANISAERLNLYSVNSFLNEGVIDATIDQY